MANPRVRDMHGTGVTRAAAKPFKPYVYKGEPDPPEVIQARHRAQATALQRQRERDKAPGAGRSGADYAGPVTGRNVPDGDELAEVATVAAARDRNQATLAAAPGPDPLPAPPPVTAASRCGRCGYLTTAPGHKVTCDE